MRLDTLYRSPRAPPDSRSQTLRSPLRIDSLSLTNVTEPTAGRTKVSVNVFVSIETPAANLYRPQSNR